MGKNNPGENSNFINKYDNFFSAIRRKVYILCYITQLFYKKINNKNMTLQVINDDLRIIFKEYPH